MNIGEDFHLSLRSIQKRPVESLLLIIGVALGIGATAAGISMISRSISSQRELLASPAYKEIVVTIRESSEDMELPASIVNNEGDDIVLTSMDLRAKDEVPDIQYAYIANPTRIDFITEERLAQMQRFGQGGGGGFGDIVIQDRQPPSGERGATVQFGDVQTEGAAAEGAAVGEGGQSDDRRPQFGQLAIVDGESGEVIAANDGVAVEGEGPTPEQIARAMEQFSRQLPEAPEGPAPVLEDIEGLEVSKDFFTAWGFNAAQGSLFTPSDIQNNSPVMVLGSEIGATLFEDGVSVGREVLVRRTLYNIIGVLEPTGTKYDKLAFVPAVNVDIDFFAGFARRIGGFNTSLHFAVFESDRLDEAKSQLETWFGQTYGENRVAISIPREKVETAQDRTSRLVSVILFLAVAGLLIASVNVSNILLGRAMRKRKNVGILKALGATVREVFGLFFFEALMIGAGGAVLGVGIAIGLSQLMIATVVSGTLISIMLFLGILASWAIVTSLTVIPALQASKIPAAEALRYE